MRSMSPELARNALEAAPDAMIIIDDSGLVCFANRQTTAMFGYAYEDIVNHSVDQLLPERFRARHIEHRREFWHGMRVRPMGTGLDLFARREDGTEFPVEISLSPVQDGERVLVSAAIRDVTERKRAEIELLTARRSAENARAVADEARESADRANQGKSRFLATASHDLRQPLQTLALLNGTMRRITKDADVADAVAQQEQAIAVMSRLLNALLDISKLESGAIRPMPTDFSVKTLFEEMRREFADTAASKGLTFDVQHTVDAVHSDRSLVEQILRNLVSNAIKYTLQGCVRLRSVSDGSHVRLEVVDTGIGIPSDQLAYIYDEFYQVGVPTNSTRDGYGLGLSIVRRIVALLQIQLGVESEVGKGSTFILTLPISRTLITERSSRSADALRPDATSKSRHLLLVEDDAAVRDATRMLLRVEGYQVKMAASLGEALAIAQTGEPIDAVVTDYHLGQGETGLHVIEGVRRTLRNRIRAVLITGDTSSAMRELVDDPLLRLASKPVDADELLALLRELLGDAAMSGTG
jgi:two-component system, sensor histidine kinase